MINVNYNHYSTKSDECQVPVRPAAASQFYTNRNGGLAFGISKVYNDVSKTLYEHRRVNILTGEGYAISRIIFDDSYVIVIPQFDDVTPHRHSFLHIFFLRDNDRWSEVYMVGKDMLHTMPPKERCRLFLMIDPTSTLAEELEENILCDGKPHYSALTGFTAEENITDEEIKNAVRKWLAENFPKVRAGNIRPADERIISLIREIRDYRHLETRISDIAKQCCLSESRLSHIFRESMGISLKGYLNIAQMEYAYKLITNGCDITGAALEAGFGSSSHLAAVIKKQTGISVTSVLKTADF